MRRVYYISVDENMFYEPTVDDTMRFAEEDQCSAAIAPDPAELLDELSRTLSAAGFDIGTPGEDDEWAFSTNPMPLEKLDAARVRYFGETFRAVRTFLENLTPARFACGMTAVTELAGLAEGSSDIAWLDEGGGPCRSDFDRFIRTMEPDRTYFFGKTVLLLE